jgi:hypothetical protein
MRDDLVHFTSPGRQYIHGSGLSVLYPIPGDSAKESAVAGPSTYHVGFKNNPIPDVSTAPLHRVDVGVTR